MGFEIDEFIVSKFFKHWKKFKKDDQDQIARRVTLDEVKPKLTLLARAITGEPIEIFPAEREGGYKNNNFFLPIHVDFLLSKQENYQFYIFRVLYLSIQQGLNLNWSPTNYQDDASISQQKALESSEKIIPILLQEYHSQLDFYHTILSAFETNSSVNNRPDYSWIYGKWMKNEHEVNSDKKLENFSKKIKEANEEKVKTIIKAKAIEDIIIKELDKKQQEDYVLLHSFEKVETADEFNGTWRDFDGEDELKEHKDALDEINMRYAVRVDDVAHSVYQSDFRENTSVSESHELLSDEFHIEYNEWDFNKREYKPNFCKVFPKKITEKDVSFYTKTLLKYQSTLIGLRKMLSSINNRMEQHKFQLSGDEFDIDSITDLFVDVKNQQTPSENIYIAKRKKQKDISILLLLDISLSSDSYAAGNKIIDVEKEVSVIFGEILNEFNVDFAIDGFYSKTRNYSPYLTIKDFDENWDPAKYKIGSIKPSGYTRIGASLRHAGEKLKTRDSKNKWIILLSDGKPNDFDKYEGKYGIYDVKQAIRELQVNHIQSYALAIEAQAQYYFPLMFGENHYQILSHPKELIHSLVKLYNKIR